ncbi:MAG: exopolysaccharide biosynthesis protein [Pseudomonadota bacterium]
MAREYRSAGELVERLGELKAEEGQSNICVDQVIANFGGRSYGPLIFVPAVLGMSPISGIPSVPTIIAVIIALIALQILIGRKHFWMPGILGNRAISEEKLGEAAQKLKGPAQTMDKWFKNRLEWATATPAPQIAAAIILCLCLTIAPLEFVPFAAAAPFSAIAAFGLAITVRDGLLMLFAFGVATTSLGLAGWLAMG